jgi:hypothetical protein
VFDLGSRIFRDERREEQRNGEMEGAQSIAMRSVCVKNKSIER